ncbi:MAG: pyridoxal-phosphate dependent enzyme [bacterium]|nr:pyridoxal-phosphate dependent enzyme [bacterium]
MNFLDLVDKTKFTIWRYAGLYPEIKPKYRLTLGEGWTGEAEVEGIVFKKEFDNPTGSIKDRGMAYQMSAVYQEGIKEAIIPSSGNGAIAAAAYGSLAGIKITAFVSKNILPGKMMEIRNRGGEVKMCEHPLAEAEEVELSLGVRNLRPSTDEPAACGFMSLSLEIFERLIRRDREIDSIFLPVSSGATLVGVGQGFKALVDQGFIETSPQIHAVQTEAVHPVAEEFDGEFRPKARSVAEAICAKETARGEEVLRLIKESGGSGWVIGDKEILAANVWLEAHDLVCSFEGALALAGLWKAKKNDWKIKAPLVVLTGKRYR